MLPRCIVLFILTGLLLLPASVSAQFLEFVEVTDTNINADQSSVGGPTDVEEKDLAAVDVDLDGDMDLIVVRKTPFTSDGPRVNVLFINIDGVLTDMTDEFAPEFDTPDNSRDVVAADFDGDGWPDFVIASSGDSVSGNEQPRCFMNLGEDAGGNWLGFQEDPLRFPILVSPTGEEPNFCNVGIGDLTGNGAPDLYFMDYQNDLEDVLLVNDGFGFFSNETDTLLPNGFENSGFGLVAEIVDMNGDGFLDIVKNAAGTITVGYNDGTGNINVTQTLPASAPYAFAVGDLNDDGRNDVYMTLDPQDDYLINNSPPGTVPVDWISVDVTDSPLTAGFGGATFIRDIDGDGDQDAIICDADVDTTSCQRRLAFLENDGATPIPNLYDSIDGPPHLNLQHQGTFEIAMADFNNDGALDVWVGHCGGNNLYFQVAPIPPVLPVTDLVCTQVGLDVSLAWQNSQGYDSIVVNRDGSPLATLGGGALSYTDVGVASGSHSYSVVGVFSAVESPSTSCVIQVSTVNPITNLNCVQFDEDIALDWSNNGGVVGGSYDAVDVLRNGLTIDVLPGGTESYLDPAPPLGITSYAVVPFIGSDSAAETTCVLNVAPTNATDLVIDFSADDGGADDSALELELALTENGRVVNHVLVDAVTDLPGLNIDLNEFERVWVELGTFPDNHTLALAEGAMLADYVEDGIGGNDLFISGGDTFCFDTQTPVHGLTGIDASCDDGFGSVANADPLFVPGCGTIDLALVTFNAEDESVDRLSPLTTGTILMRANVGGSEFTSAVVNTVGAGVVISQSVELGGFGNDHDKADLVEMYLHCFPSGFPPPVAEFSGFPTSGAPPLTVQFTSEATGNVQGHGWIFGDGGTSVDENPVHIYDNVGTYSVTYFVEGTGGQDDITKTDYIMVLNSSPDFVRGDGDGDGVFNGLTDALFLLDFQFQGGATPPCMDATDFDDDGMFNGLTDSLGILGFQFQGGPPPPPPGLGCGPDPTADGLDCISGACP